MEASFLMRHPKLKDALNFVLFVALVLIGTLIINSYIFRSFNVNGPSMESTLYTGDKLIVNRVPVTIAALQNKTYLPDRGDIIVFKNPRYTPGTREEFLVKRVIAFPGERVLVRDGALTVYNTDHPDGFHPDDTDTNGKPGSPTSGDSDMVVPDGTIYVAGDHREGSYSLDSRNQLGTIPFVDIIGPVGLRIWPLTDMRLF